LKRKQGEGEERRIPSLFPFDLVDISLAALDENYGEISVEADNR
jgi:hypothetical protein